MMLLLVCRLAAADTAPASNLKGNQFYDLSERKAQLVTNRANLTQESQRLTQSLPDIKATEDQLALQARRLSELDKFLEDAKKGAKPDQTRIEYLTAQREGVDSSMQTAKQRLNGNSYASVQAEIAQKRTDLEKNQAELEDVQHKILSILTPEQDFKTTISAYFSILIGIVITGFFVVALLDPSVRRAIFSGQAGIQFVTLFSLVIAIILFGITGILESKELSALLGGLSGYILGKVATRETSAAPSVGSPPAAPGKPQLTSKGGAIDANVKSVENASAYSWFVKIAGKDTDFRLVSNSTEPHAILRDARFAANDTVEVGVAALNGAGQSGLSPAETVTIA